MSRFFAFITTLTCAALIVVCSSGCENLSLDDGKYQTSIDGREDFAAVYGDLIFIHLLEPSDDISSKANYWIWAGKFSIEDDGHIILDMDKKLSREWNFAYDLYRRPGAITVYDHSSGNSFDLKLRSFSNSPAPNALPHSAPRESSVYK